MADLNALIAQGYQFQPLPDPFAQYGKMQQLENSASQNRLAQQQLAASQRAEAQTNTLNQAYSSAVNPATGEIDYAKLRSAVASGGAGSQIPGIEKERLAAKKAGLETQELEGKIVAQPVALAAAKSKAIDEQLKRSRELLDRIDPANPNVRDQLMAWHQGNHTGYLGELLKSQGSTPEKTMADIDAAVAAGPQGIANFISRSVLGSQEFGKKIAPIPEEVSNGQEKWLRDKNSFSPTYLQEIPGSRVKLQMSPYETDHLQFLKDKEKFDQENPGFELKEITQRDGTTKTVKVNKKTGAYSDVVSEGPGGAPLAGVSIPAQDLDLKKQDLAFRQQKAAFEQANPTLSIQQVNQSDGSAIVVAVNTKDATYRPVVAQGDTFVPAGPAMPISGGMPPAAAPSAAAAPLAAAAPSAVAPAATVSNALVGGNVNNSLVSTSTGAGRPLISAAKPTAPPTDQALMTALGFPLTPAGYTAFKDAQRQDRLLNLAEEQQKIRIALASRPPGGAATPAAPVAVVGTDGKIKYVSREEAIAKGMTPASAQEGLAPKEIQAREAKYPAATSAVKTFETKTDSLAADLETLAKHPGLSGISGLIYGRTLAVTKEARAAQALYDSILARAGFAELQNMRAASPTGGALGNVSNQEGQYLRDAFAPINRTQDTKDLSLALTNAANVTRAAKQRVREAYDMTYDYKTGGAPAAKPGGGEWKVVK